jgi:hypothetical protein
MRLPIDVTKVTVLSIGAPQPAKEFGSNEPRLTTDGKPIYKVPVLLSGTGDRVDPTATITVSGVLPSFTSGQRLRCTNLTISTWTMRDSGGRERSGATLRADAIEVENDAKPVR